MTGCMKAASSFVDKLSFMGARTVICDPHRVIIHGQAHSSMLILDGVSSPDIRAGMAMLLAALMCQRGELQLAISIKLIEVMKTLNISCVRSGRKSIGLIRVILRIA